MKPAIDLLIPVYNGRPYLDRLTSGLKQTKSYFNRIIFYDDASKDDSADRLKKCGFEVIRGPENRGQAYSRGVLLKESSSEYVHFHDVDDEITEPFFAKVVPSLEPDQISIGRTAAEYPKHSVEYNLPPSLQTGFLSLQDAYDYFIHLNAVIFPRKVMLAAGGFEAALRLHEDRFLFLRLADAKVRMKGFPDARAAQLWNGNSLTTSKNQTFYRVNWIRYFELALAMLPPEKITFLHDDLLRVSRELMRDREREMAKRGFALCDQIGAENFKDLTPRRRSLVNGLGFYRGFMLWKDH